MEKDSEGTGKLNAFDAAAESPHNLRPMIQEKTTVLEHICYQGEYRMLTFAAPGIGPKARPGKFIHLRVPRLEQCVLRRPFSIFKADAGSVSILYKSVGKGTQAMMDVQPGEEVNLLGPLGTGFPAPVKDTTAVALVGGGYGSAALYLQAVASPVKGTVFIGGRSAGDILCIKEFKALGWDVVITTDDGSCGRQGLVTQALDEWLHERAGNLSAVEVFACGPNGMLEAIGARAVAQKFTAWLSMDRNMACGTGACLTCVIKRKKKTGGWEWVRCCKEGPVFNAEEIYWD